MATLQELIDYSKANPTSDIARKTQKAIIGGVYDQEASNTGVDLSWAGRPKTMPTAKPDSMVSNVQNDINTRGQNIQNELNNSQQNPIVSGFKATAEGAKAIGDVAVDVAKPLVTQGKNNLDAIFGGNPLYEGTKTAVKKGIAMANDGVSKIEDSDMFAKIGQKINDIASKHPKGYQAIDDALNILSSSGDIANTALGAEGIVGATKDTVGVAKNIADSTKEAMNASKVSSEIKAPITVDNSKKLKSVAIDWERPAKMNSPGYNNVRKSLANSPETPNFLAEQGLNPSEHIEDGKYSVEATKGSADSLRDTAGKMSSETLRPSLQEADYSTPKTPIVEIESNAIRDVQKSKNITPKNMKVIVKNIKEETAALKEKYPEGMSLTDMHDNKITYSKNSGYSPFNDPKVNNPATGNRSLSGTLGDMVVAKAPKDIPVQDFNDYLSKYYKGADYLEALGGKKAPVSLGQQIARGVAKFGGAAVGAKFGGGVVSEFAGYQMGKALEHALENLTNPARAAFLRNLKVSNPKAFDVVSKYLTEQEVARSSRLALPPPSYIPLGAETETSAIGFPAKAESIRNPKTGKYDRVYTSEIKKSKK